MVAQVLDASAVLAVLNGEAGQKGPLLGLGRLGRHKRRTPVSGPSPGNFTANTGLKARRPQGDPPREQAAFRPKLAL